VPIKNFIGEALLFAFLSSTKSAQNKRFFWRSTFVRLFVFDKKCFAQNKRFRK